MHLSFLGSLGCLLINVHQLMTNVLISSCHLTAPSHRAFCHYIYEYSFHVSRTVSNACQNTWR